MAKRTYKVIIERTVEVEDWDDTDHAQRADGTALRAAAMDSLGRKDLPPGVRVLDASATVEPIDAVTLL